MKKLTFTLLFALIGKFAFSQTVQGRFLLDSLKRQLTIAKHDTSRILIMAELCLRYRIPNSDSALLFGEQALKLARKINFPKGEIRALCEAGRLLLELGSLPKSLEMQFKALQVADDNHLPVEKGRPLASIASVYFTLKNYPKALNYYRQALVILEALHRTGRFQKMNLGNVFEKMNQLDSALYYEQQAYKETLQAGVGVDPIILRNLGNIQVKLRNNRLAMDYYQKSLQLHYPGSIGGNKASVLHLIAELYQKQNQPDSSIYYAQRGLEESKLTSYKQGVLDNSALLSELYEAKVPLKAFQYYKIAMAAKDSLFGANQLQTLQNIIVDEQVRQREVEAERVAYQNQLRQYAFLAGLGVLLLIAFILYRANKQQKRVNNLLHHQKEEINLQRDKAENALSQLKSTQTQLIQKEKLASLGELTAGIAHEIQNPLNFVNNFSSLNSELVDELNEELDKGNIIDVKAIANGIKANSEKISTHGHRASSIVKGMLDHSRTSTGEKELTDINELADEYLRLSYHGLRAKDQSFQADYELIADKNLPKINVIPQEIGRVLLNLINNAFQSPLTL